jgi:hypothetical protein
MHLSVQVRIDTQDRIARALHMADRGREQGEWPVDPFQGLPEHPILGLAIPRPAI